MSKVYVLDTSAVLHNWNVLKERTSIVPQCALDDVERFQNEPGDVGDNARNASWWLSDMLDRQGGDSIDSGDTHIRFWRDNDERSHDAKVIRTANEVRQDRSHFNDEVVILTKSISLRAKARMEGIDSEDYDDVGLVDQIDGWREMEITVDEMQEITGNRTSDTFRLDGRKDLGVNEYVVCTVNGERCSGMVYRHLGGGMFQKLDLKPHMSSVVPQNPEQVMLANSLLDPEIPLVSAVGAAGSGKTLLAIAAAIQLTMIRPKIYKKIIITRPVMPIGRDIGFLPGDVNDKMAEWIRPFMNNIEFIRDMNEANGKRRISAEKINMLLDLSACHDFMEVLPLTYIRGCSISNAFIIVDEAQNATPSEMKTIITRVGEGSKLVLMGDVNQIDNRFLSRECNGLTMAIKKFWNHRLYSHVTLKSVERSRLAELATQILF